MKKILMLIPVLMIALLSVGQTQMNVPVTFDDATVNYGLVGFGGAEDATVVTDPTLATNKVGRVVKSATAELWAGASITALAGTVQTSFANAIPFTATERRMNVRVWSPHTNISIKLKVEDKTDPTKSCETDAMFTGAANTWQTLEFNFNNQSAGTAAFNPAFTFNKASIFFNFGVTGAVAGQRIYFFDDVKFGAAGGGGGTSTLPILPLDFESATLDYTFTDFGGGATTKIANPQISGINTSANVARMVKGAPEVFAGSFITLASPINFSVNKSFRVKVYSPRVGAKLLLKVENATNGAINFEREATSTVANAWEELVFDYSTISTTEQYSKLIFIFDLGTAGNGSANFTWLFDDVRLVAAGGGGGGLTQMNVPVTFDDATVNYGLVGFGGAEDATVVTDPTLATNKVGRVLKSNTAELWAGASITALAGTVQTSFANAIPFTATERRMNVRVWSPHTNISIKLKVEDKNDPTRSVETDVMFTAAANTWQTLEFNFNNQSAGTAAFNPAFTYNKASIFFNFGVTGAVAGQRIYFFDDVKFGAAGGGGGTSTLPILPLDFESATLDYTFTDFGGGATTKIANPQISGINTSANVARMVKGAPEVFAGSFITLASPINFSVNKSFRVKVYSPRVGAKLLLKVENATNGAINFEREATSTVANAWEELVFDYSTISTTEQYSKLIFIFDLGTAGNGSANFTWLFDDVRLVAAGGGGGGLTQMNVPVTFDDATVNYGLVGFGGAEDATVVTDPTLATNKVGRVLKSNTAELWAGASITALAGTVQTSFANAIPFTATERRMNVRVWSPHTNISIKLKVEDKTDPTKSCETDAMFTGAANTWQTLEFNFNNQSAGTAAFNAAFTYNKASIFFNFGVTGATAGQRIYFFDDVKFGAISGGGGGGLTQMNVPVTFDDATVNYGLVGFGGAEDATVVTDPTLATNKVGRVVKSATAELWAGASITALAGTVQTSFANAIPFTATERRMNVRVWSPHTNISIKLKVEDKTDPTKSVETDVMFTGAANTWQTLEFNFNNQSAGTAAFNAAFTYNKASIFFNFGVTGATAGQRIYFFDDVKFGAISGGGGGGLTQMNVPVTFDDATVNYGLVGFGGAEDATVVTDPTLATNKVGRVLKSNTAELWAGASITALAGTVQTSFANAIPFTATERRMNVRVWSPHTGIQIRLKVEDKTDPTKSVETEATFTGAANTWQTLEFNFNNQAPGTAAFNPAFTFNKASIFFNFGVTGAVAGQRIYFFDDVRSGAAPPPPAPPAPVVSTPVTYCQNATSVALTATALTGNTLRWYTTATLGTPSPTAPIPSTATAGSTSYYVSQINAAMIESVRAVIVVTVNQAPAAPTVVSPLNLCLNAASVPLNAQAATGNTLKWYTTATGGIGSLNEPVTNSSAVGNTSYYVSQTNTTGCESPRATLIVSIKPLPAVPVLSASSTTIVPGATNTLTVTGTGTNAIQWFKNNSVLPGQTGTTISVNVDGIGSYKVVVTSLDGCVSTSNTLQIVGGNTTELSVYPNPSTGRFELRYFSDVNNLRPRSVAIYDSKGATVYKGQFVIYGAYTSMQIDLSTRGAGNYFIQLFDNVGNKISSKQIVIYK